MSISGLWVSSILNESQNIVHSSESRTKLQSVVDSDDVKLYSLPAVAPTNNDVMLFQANGTSSFVDTTTFTNPYALLNDTGGALVAGQHLISNGGAQDVVPSQWVSENGSGVNFLAGCQTVLLSATSISHMDTYIADNGNVNMSITGGLDKKFILSDPLEINNIVNSGSNVEFDDGVKIVSASTCEADISFNNTGSLSFDSCSATISDAGTGDLLFQNCTGSYKFDKDLQCESSLVINDGADNVDVTFSGNVLSFNSASATSYDFGATVNIASFKAQSCNNGVIRPVAPSVGEMFFDTNLIVPRPIWWSSTLAWIDSAGVPV